MKADDPAFRLAVRRDRTSSLVILLAVAAMILAMVSVLVLAVDDVATRRSQPVYWLVMLPFVAWGVALITYQPFALKTVLPFLGIFTTIAALATVAAFALERDFAGQVVILGLVAATSAAAAMLRGRSLIGRARDV